MNRTQHPTWLLSLLLVALLGCQATEPSPTPILPTNTIAVAQLQPSPSLTPDTPTPQPTHTPTHQPTHTPTNTNTPTPTNTWTPSPTPTITPTPTATRDPYKGMSIEELRQEEFGEEGEIEILSTMETSDYFTRYKIRYPSDGIRIGGFMNVPFGDGPFPVVIVNHGYMPTYTYETLTYTTEYADWLANSGFLVLHVNYRNHRGSGWGKNPFRIGYARDILHLIPMAQRLPQANGAPVGMWGHSMGGGITLRVLAVSDQIKAAFLYASMSGDEANNYHAMMNWTNGYAARSGALPAPPTERELYDSISPIEHFENLTATLAIHHGVRDDQVPYEWSQELAQRLDEYEIPYEFYTYPGQNHNFVGQGYYEVNQHAVDFFWRHLQ